MSGEHNLIQDYEAAPVTFKGLPVTSNGAEEEKKAFGHAVTVATTTIVGRDQVVELEGRSPTDVRPFPFGAS